MKILLFLVILSNAVAVKTQVPSFPSDWLGNWKGTLLIYSQSSDVLMVDMSLTIKEKGDHRYTWQLHYGALDDTAGIRHYSLQLDTSANQWQIDEHNGIILSGYCFEDTFISAYTVAENHITVRYRLNENQIEFTLTSTSLHDGILTGDKVQNQDTIPSVVAYSIPVMQRAILYRQ